MTQVKDEKLEPDQTVSDQEGSEKGAEEGGEGEVDYKALAEERGQKLADTEERLARVENDRRAVVGQTLKREDLARHMRNIDISSKAHRDGLVAIAGKIESGKTEGLTDSVREINDRAQFQLDASEADVEMEALTEQFNALTGGDDPGQRSQRDAEARKRWNDLANSDGSKDPAQFRKMVTDAAIAGRDAALAENAKRDEAIEAARKEERARVREELNADDLGTGPEAGAGDRAYTHREAAQLYNEGKIDAAAYAKSRGK